MRRRPINKDNDIVIYSSIATTYPEPFTEIERGIHKAGYDKIKSILSSEY